MRGGTGPECEGGYSPHTVLMLLCVGLKFCTINDNFLTFVTPVLEALANAIMLTWKNGIPGTCLSSFS